MKIGWIFPTRRSLAGMTAVLISLRRLHVGRTACKMVVNKARADFEIAQRDYQNLLLKGI